MFSDLLFKFLFSLGAFAIFSTAQCAPYHYNWPVCTECYKEVIDSQVVYCPNAGGSYCGFFGCVCFVLGVYGRLCDQPCSNICHSETQICGQWNNFCFCPSSPKRRWGAQCQYQCPRGGPSMVDCAGHGTCINTGGPSNGSCQCNDGWRGDNCAITVTPPITPTVTLPLTPTKTFSATQTFSFTGSYSKTLTVTQSLSGSSSPSQTLTSTPSVSFTISPSVSQSQSLSRTLTITPPETPTVTHSLTYTLSPTSSLTATKTDSASLSFTNTLTISPSKSITVSFTGSESRTKSISLTVTISPGPTLSVPLTRSRSLSRSGGTGTFSTSASKTSTSTISPPRTMTVTPSLGRTRSLTLSISQGTKTSSASFPPTATLTLTQTRTLSPSVYTPSQTKSRGSKTLSAPPTWSSTLTWTPMATLSISASGSKNTKSITKSGLTHTATTFSMPAVPTPSKTLTQIPLPIPTRTRTLTLSVTESFESSLNLTFQARYAVQLHFKVISEAPCFVSLNVSVSCDVTRIPGYLTEPLLVDCRKVRPPALDPSGLENSGNGPGAVQHLSFYGPVLSLSNASAATAIQSEASSSFVVSVSGSLNALEPTYNIPAAESFLVLLRLCDFHPGVLNGSILSLPGTPKSFRMMATQSTDFSLSVPPVFVDYWRIALTIAGAFAVGFTILFL